MRFESIHHEQEIIVAGNQQHRYRNQYRSYQNFKFGSISISMPFTQYSYSRTTRPTCSSSTTHLPLPIFSQPPRPQRQSLQLHSGWPDITPKGNHPNNHTHHIRDIISISLDITCATTIDTSMLFGF